MRESKLKITLIIVLVALIASGLLVRAATKPGSDNRNQPLGNFDKMLRQSNISTRVEGLMDNKLATNTTNLLSEMTLNMNKIILENKRLSSQLQEVVNRVQNTTGISPSVTVNRLQQQAPNMTANLNELSFTNIDKIARGLGPALGPGQ